MMCSLCLEVVCAVWCVVCVVCGCVLLEGVVWGLLCCEDGVFYCPVVERVFLCAVWLCVFCGMCVYLMGLTVVWARGKILYCVLRGWIGLWCDVSVIDFLGEVVSFGQGCVEFWVLECMLHVMVDCDCMWLLVL